MTRIFIVLAAILGGLAVAGGAFATHALREKLTERALEIFETATRYQMYHALAILMVAVLMSRAETAHTLLVVSGLAFFAGITLFCGSLYGISLSGIKGLGAIAPFGGAAFLIGWGCLSVAALSFK
jgi:uncharacterized membrane protein YgdD (TMEM256/DUF423 family)